MDVRKKNILAIMVWALLVVVSFNIWAQDLPPEELPEQPPPLIPPVLKNKVEAVYPEAALKEGISAEVLMEIDIDTDGMVEGVNVTGPATPSGYGFDEAAVEAAILFEFEPAMEGDIPVPVRITYRYRFEIPTPEPDEMEQNRKEEKTEKQLKSDAQNIVNFTGQIVERGTRMPLVGVQVLVFQKEGEEAVGFESITDENGIFEFFNLPEGNWGVMADPDAYYPLRTTEEITKGKKIEAKYHLEKNSYNPYDVTVEGESLRKEVSKTSLDVVEIEKVPGTVGDVLNVVKNLPGVARTGPISGNIVVRGSSPEDSSIFVNGSQVPSIYHFGGLRSVIPLGMLDGIDFYPGNFSSQFGRATGGIVDVRLKKLNPEKIGGYVDVNLADSGVFLEAPIGEKAAIAVAARRSYVDVILNSVVPDSANVNLVTAPRYYDYQLLGTYRPNSKHEFTGFLFGSDDKLKLLFDNPADISPDLQATDISTSTSFYRTILEYNFRPSGKFENELKTSAGRNWIYFGAGDQLFLDLDNYIAQVKDKMTFHMSDSIRLSAGLDYLFVKSDARIKFPTVAKEGEPAGKPDLNEVQFSKGSGEVFQSMSGFFEVESRFFDRLTVVPGIRFDYYSRINETSLAPRLNTRFSITDQWVAKGAVGFYHQEPSFDETDDVFGNPDLGLESAVHYSVGVEYRPFDHLTLDVTGFYKDLSDLVSRTEQTVTRDGETVPQNYVNGGNGRVYGMEVLLRHEFANNFSGWLSYTLSRAERKDYGADNWRLFDYDQTHILTVLGTYHLPKNWNVGFRWRLVSGDPSTPREGAIYDVDDGLYVPVPGSPNSERLPVFHQLDVRLDKRWIFKHWMLTAYLDIQNAYNQPNSVGYSYNYDSTEKKPRTSLPILPIIGIKGEF